MTYHLQSGSHPTTPSGVCPGLEPTPFHRGQPTAHHHPPPADHEVTAVTRIRRSAAVGRRVVATLTVVVLTVVGLAVVVPSLVGFHLYAIATGSMTGTLDVGTLAIAREVPVDDLAVGDIITYVPPADTGIAHPVTHRIATIERGEGGVPTFVTRGDANGDVDPWDFSLDAATQARVERQIPWLGQPVLALTDPRTRFLAIGIPALAVGLLALRDLVAALRPIRDPGPDTTAVPDAEGPPATTATPAAADVPVARAPRVAPAEVPELIIVVPEAEPTGTDPATRVWV